MGQAVIDAKVDKQTCLITEDHPGFHCPNCRTRLEEDVTVTTRPCGLWYSSPPSQVALDALLVMYNQKHKWRRRDENKFRFVQTTVETARNNAQFETVLKAQQEAQREFSSVDRRDTSAVYQAYNRLSLSTAKMLKFYLQCTCWSEEHYKNLIGSQLEKYGLNTHVLNTL